ncbi:MAG: hypothetical protein SFV22_10065, partial [Saprospiraceae bacterium]|nr:hypothetical protein [Saprospiraceae bacterium]
MNKTRIILFLFAIITWSDCKKSEQDAGQIGALNCTAFQLSGSIVVGQPVSGTTFIVPYTGGNGGKYEAAFTNSSGVTGLTALLDAGSFTEGNGAVTYTLTGTPSGAGNAIFSLSLGGQSCFVSILVTQPVGLVTNINCAAVQPSAPLIDGVNISGVSFSVPYNGGNGGTYDAQTVFSTGITGITASLSAGNFNNGSGNLTYQLNGTPSGTGTANFNILVGGQNCSIGISVTSSGGSVSSLNCNNVQLNGTLVAWMAVELMGSASFSVPYTGGNGGSYSTQMVSSVGVSGLTATLSAGNFTSGNGSVIYQLTGTPSNIGSAIFSINLGGQSCNVLINVNAPSCGAFVTPGQWKSFMCYNLGSASTNVDPFEPSWEINGGYWQWGQKEQAASGPTGSGSSQANSGSIIGWNTTSAADDAWLSVVKTANDPCPAGYRVPTYAQWSGVIANNTWTNVGAWNESITNYGAGKKIGNNMFLPAAGSRDFNNGILGGRGSYSNYWSSESGTVL